MPDPDGRIRWLMSNFGGDLEALPPPPSWFTQAACQGHDPELWFPTKGETGAEAKRICAGCPVRGECLDWALSDIDVAGGDRTTTTQRYGIIGGLSAKERTRMAQTDEGPFAAEAALSPRRPAGDAARGERLIAEALRRGASAA